MSLFKVGDVQHAASDRAGALAAYKESLGVLRKLTAANPGNFRWQNDMNLVLNKIGDMLDDRPGALAAYEEGLAIMRKVSAANRTIPSGSEQ